MRGRSGKRFNLHSWAVLSKFLESPNIPSTSPVIFGERIHLRRSISILARILCCQTRWLFRQDWQSTVFRIAIVAYVNCHILCMRNDIRGENGTVGISVQLSQKLWRHTRAVRNCSTHTLIIGKTPRWGYSNLKRNFTLSLYSREKNFRKHFAYGDDFTVLF